MKNTVELQWKSLRDSSLRINGVELPVVSVRIQAGVDEGLPLVTIETHAHLLDAFLGDAQLRFQVIDSATGKAIELGDLAELVAASPRDG